MAILAHVRDSVLGLSPADRAGSRVQSKCNSVFRWENNFRGRVSMGLSCMFECQSRSINDHRASSFPRESRMKTSSSASVAAGARAINAPGLTFEQRAEARPYRASKIVFPPKNRGTFRLYSTPGTVRGRESENTVANMC